MSSSSNNNIESNSSSPNNPKQVTDSRIHQGEQSTELGSIS